jgi:hypothetical protein
MLGCGEPHTLDATGLYDADGNVAESVVAYAPRYPMWSDGSTKSRWILLPDGETIDTSDPDAWVFPIGTKIWMEFSSGNSAVETRMLHKVRETKWKALVYEWQGDKAKRVRKGVENSSGNHDIPSEEDCESCHTHAPDGPLGLSALQLGFDQDALVALFSTPVDPLPVPGDALDQGLLGTLAANCGTCHSQRFGLTTTSIDLSLTSDRADSVEDTPMWETCVDVESDVNKVPGMDATLRIKPGKPNQSLLYLRATTRDNGAMPPLATEEVDSTLDNLLDEWITRLTAGYQTTF